MFGITFVDAAGEPLELEPLLLPPGFEGHPLRKDFALQARLDRALARRQGPGTDRDAPPTTRGQGCRRGPAA